MLPIIVMNSRRLIALTPNQGPREYSRSRPCMSASLQSLPKFGTAADRRFVQILLQSRPSATSLYGTRFVLAAGVCRLERPAASYLAGRGVATAGVWVWDGNRAWRTGGFNDGGAGVLLSPRTGDHRIRRRHRDHKERSRQDRRLQYVFQRRLRKLAYTDTWDTLEPANGL